jgi:hypothetical protein
MGRLQIDFRSSAVKTRRGSLDAFAAVHRCPLRQKKIYSARAVAELGCGIRCGLGGHVVHRRAPCPLAEQTDERSYGAAECKHAGAESRRDTPVPSSRLRREVAAALASEGCAAGARGPGVLAKER